MELCLNAKKNVAKGSFQEIEIDQDFFVLTYKNESGKNKFLFLDSHQEMLAEFQLTHPDLKQVPYDWTIYY